MFHYLGDRFKNIRNEVYRDSQDQFAKRINDYLIRKYGTKVPNKFLFNQVIISSLESKFKISKDKLVILINFINTSKSINPLWIFLENNNSQKKFIKEIIFDEGVIQKQKKIKNHMDSIEKEINDISIIVENMYNVD